MIPVTVIRSTLCHVLSDRLALVASTSSIAAAFARAPSTIPEQVLVRHAVEHVFRIRMFRPLDARATSQLRAVNPRVAEVWARYARSEAVHDRYFLRDLRAMGVERETVEALRPFAATSRLGRFVDAAARAHGPLPLVLYSFLAEQSSEAGSLPVIARNREAFGAEAARGASAHRNLDRHLDHAGMISNVLAAIVRETESLLEAARLLETIADLIGEYFSELDAWNRQAIASANHVAFSALLTAHS